MKHPNFFVVGAPKTGSTALSEYLRAHPRIFMCPLKEPDFFTRHTHPRYQKVKSIEEYLSLFASAGDEHLAVGEASVSYLNSETALRGLQQFAPDARLIAMVRNPIDLAYSAHSQAVFAFAEPEKDFERAWALQEDRAAGRNVPPRASDKDALLYKNTASLGMQLERLLQYFDREQVHIIVFEDFVADTRGVYEDTLRFLNVPTDNRTEFPRYNENKRHKADVLGRIIVRPPTAIMRPIRRVQQALGIEGGTGVLRFLQKLNSTELKRPPMRPEFRERLAAEFADDVAKLERILDRDLSHWLRVEPVADQSPSREAGS